MTVAVLSLLAAAFLYLDVVLKNGIPD